MSAIAAIHPGFLEDICAYREDDTPRLIYADWLEDNGQEERAEFIRVQCELARMDEAGDGVIDPVEGHTCVEYPCPVCAMVERYGALRRREQELLAHWGERWATPVAKVFDLKQWGNAGATCGPGDPKAGIGWKFRRGFVAEVCAPIVDLICHLPRLVEAHPLEVVRVSDREPREHLPGRWGWTIACDWSSRPNGSNHVPLFLTEAIRGKPSPQEARAWLSTCLLAWARNVEPCPLCDGSGLDPFVQSSADRCPDCRGIGWALKEGR